MNIPTVYDYMSKGKLPFSSNVLSSELVNYFELWDAIGKGRAPWNEKAHSSGIPLQIANKLVAIIQSEMKIRSEDKSIEGVIKRLDSDLYKIVYYLVVNGGSILRPIFVNGKLQYEILPQGNYFPLTYDYDGTLTSCVILKEFTSRQDIGKTIRDHYLLTELHSYSKGEHRIENSLYKIGSIGGIKEVGLKATPETEELQEKQSLYTLSPLITEFKTRKINYITGGNVALPIIAGAEELIKDADEQYSRMLWEQEGGQMRVFADHSLFTKKQVRDGRIVDVKMTQTLNKLVSTFMGDGIGEKAPITIFAPSLRSEAQNTTYQEILKRIELVTNIGKGTISDLEDTQQTATQFMGGRQVLFSLVDNIEDEIEGKIKTAGGVFYELAKLYKLEGVSKGKPQGDLLVVTYNDDQTRKDIVVAKSTSLQELNSGVLLPYEYRMRYFGEDEKTAKEKVGEAGNTREASVFEEVDKEERE